MKKLILYYFIEFTIFIAYSRFIHFVIVTLLRMKICVFIANLITCVHPSRAFLHHSNMLSDYAPLQIAIGLSRTNNVDRDVSVTTDLICHGVNECWHIVQDNLGERHICLVIEAVDSDGNVLICVDLLVVPQSFFTFPMQTAKSHLIELLEDEEEDVILAAEFEHAIRFQGLYDLPNSTLIMKTHCICVIQRKWKHIYNERMQKLKARGSLRSQRIFELCGKYY